MRRGPVQDRTVIFKNRRSQRLGLSELFQLLHSGERTKQKKRAVSAEGEGPGQRLLILFLFLAVCYESGKPGIINMRDPSK